MTRPCLTVLQVPARFSDISALYQHVVTVVGRDLPGAGTPSLSVVHGRDGWEARLRVTWPEPAHYLSRARIKREAIKHVKATMLRSVAAPIIMLLQFVLSTLIDL